MRHRSSVQQLLLSINSILDYLDCTIKSHVDMIFLNFRKAFDSASHNELLVSFGPLALQVTCGTGLELTLPTENSMSL